MIQNVRDLVVGRFGAPITCRVNSLISSVGTSLDTFLKQNPRRLGFSITNHSANTLYIGWWEDVSSTKCWQVGPGGGNMEFVWFEDGEQVGWRWNCIGSAAATTFTCVETLVGDQKA